MRTSVLEEIKAKEEAARHSERYLSDAEMQTATARRSFVEEDYASLDLSEVLSLTQSALQSGDRVQQWLASRYASKRAYDENMANSGYMDENKAANVRRLKELAGELDKQLAPNTAKRKETLATLKAEAVKAREHVRWRSMTHEERVAATDSPFR